MEYPKHRFEFFSDGIMAIIMTIMVLEIPISKAFSFQDIENFVKPILIFFVSFFVVGWFLNRHHHLINNTKIITNKIFWKNILFLFFVALVPVFTKLVIESDANNMAIILYNIIFLLANVSFIILGHEARKQITAEEAEIINAHHREMRELAGKKYIYIKLIIGFVWIMLLGLVVSSILFPKISLILYIGFPIAFALVNMLIERDPKRKHIYLKK